MREVGGYVVLGREGDPGLNAEKIASRHSQLCRRALGMDNSGPGRHPTNLARAGGSHSAEIVAMDDLSVDKVGHSSEAGMRAWPNVEGSICIELFGPKMVQ
ncbi:Uncharacterized protein MLTONO_0479 [Mesorhizobium loti]|nr:Uncharacterized protein MLTONO_0479 [Mesorhizobium loti]